MHERVFHLLLRLYPAQFRQTHGEEALQLFRDRLRDETGMVRRTRLWLDLLTDFGALRLRGYRELALAPVAYGRDRAPSFVSLEEERLQARSLLWGGILSVILCGSVLFALEHGRGHLPLQQETYSANAPNSNVPLPKLRARVEFTFQPLNRSKTPVFRLKAVVRPLDGGPVPTGKVNFLYGWRTMATGTLVDGKVTLDAKLPNNKGLTMDALYLGDMNYSNANSMEKDVPVSLAP